LTRRVTIQVLASNRGPEYADQAVTGRSRVQAGDRLFDAQGRPCEFVEHSGGELVVVAEDECPSRFKPEALGCYAIHVNRTERGLAKEQLRDYWGD